MPREVSAGGPGRKPSSEIRRAISLLYEVAAAGETDLEDSGRFVVVAGRLEHNLEQAELAVKEQEKLTLFYSDDQVHRAYLDGMVVVLRILDDSRSAQQQRPPYQRFY